MENSALQRIPKFFTGIALSLILTTPVSAENNSSPWAVFYGYDAPTKAFSPFNLVVLDSATQVPVQTLRDSGKTVLGYISLGEVASHRSYFKAVEAQGMLLEENPNWPGSFSVDLRNKQWTARVINELIPDILRRGFDGIFIDTLDNPPEWERLDPQRFQGMTTATIRLLRTIRERFPRIKIMLNRAYAILPYAGGYVDIVLGESVFSTYNFETKHYQKVDPELYRQQLEILNSARGRFPNLQIMTLDYWNADDSAGIDRIYTEQRKNGFSPYVSTIELDQIIYEPSK